MKKKEKMISGILSVLLLSAMLLSDLPVSAYGMEMQGFSAGEEITFTDGEEDIQAESLEEGIQVELPEEDIQVELSEEDGVSANAIINTVKINKANFPDENFRNWVTNNADTSNDNVLSRTELEAVIDCEIGNRDIHDLKGIEWFFNLQELYCSYNQLTNLDVSGNSRLVNLYCSNNQLESLDISNNSNLTSIYCDNNQLISLDLSNKPALSILNCENNQLINLDTSDNSALEFLNCDNNYLTSLILSCKSAIGYLSCNYNQLTSLDLSDKPALYSLSCENNQLASLDMSNKPHLQALICNYNQLKSLDMSNKPDLNILICDDNQLKSLDVSNKPDLNILSCDNNQLTSLDVSGNPALHSLSFKNNQLTSIDVSNNPALTHLGYGYNQLTSIDLSNNSDLEFICSVNNQIKISTTAGQYNLNNLPGFDVSKASNWKGGKIKGNILIVEPGAKKVTYSYNTGSDNADFGTATFTLTVAAPVVIPVIKGVKVTGNSAEVILSEKCEGMEGYDYVISSDPNYTESGKYVKENKNVRAEKTTFRYLKKGAYYAFCRAWKNVNGKKELTGWSAAYPFKISAVTPGKPVITSVKAKGSTVKVTYKASKNADGYEVVLGKSVKKEYDGEKRPAGYGKLIKKNVKGNVVTVTFKNVPKGTYYAGLHAFNKTSNNGKKVLSPWSAAKKVTVK